MFEEAWLIRRGELYFGESVDRVHGMGRVKCIFIGFLAVLLIGLREGASGVIKISLGYR